MQLKFYNTLTRKKEKFVSIKKGEVGMYVCGPTIYNHVHIGNWRAYFVSDILRRILRFSGYKIKEVMNLTDVDDKTIRDSKKQGISLKEFTSTYEKSFLDGIKKMNIEKPEVIPRATEHIKKMIEIVKKLLDKGFAYKADDGIYFSISKFKDYGKLSKIDLSELKEGASKRVLKDEYDKESANDFVLWKFYSKDDGNVFWETELGKGRPGWHIECSAMSSKYLGEQFDIHTGGIDHINVHHTNEIAQSESSFGKKPWVRYWLHNAHLILKDGKMSKSSGSIVRLKDLEEKGFKPLSYRYLCLLTHYGKKMIFSWENLKAAQKTYEKLKNNISEFKDDKKINDEYLKKFGGKINDDLNFPEAIQVLWKFVKDKNAKGKVKTIKKMDEVLGLNLFSKGKKEKIPQKVLDLVEKRKEAREKKNWKKADELRDNISELGYVVNDTSEGSEVLKK